MCLNANNVVIEECVFNNNNGGTYAKYELTYANYILVNVHKKLTL